MHTRIMRYIWQKVIEGEHHPENDTLSLLSFMGETKKEAINLTFNKTQSQKIYSNYAKRKKRYCFQSEHVLKSCTVASPTIKNGMQKCFITRPPSMPSRVEKKPSRAKTDIVATLIRR